MNMLVIIVGLIIIGFATWGALDHLTQGIIVGDSTVGGTEQAIEVYVTIVLLAVFGFLLGMITLMADCYCGDGDIFGGVVEVSVTTSVCKNNTINMGY